jgi:hypothetical protein
MAGISNDQTDAATITPEAKPSNDLRVRIGISFLNKNTKAAPKTVPAKGISIAKAIPFIGGIEIKD